VSGQREGVVGRWNSRKFSEVTRNRCTGVKGCVQGQVYSDRDRVYVE
jgi:hypothetical protein